MSTSGGAGASPWEPVPVPTIAGGWDVGVGATLLAPAALMLPLTIVFGVNDQFVYTPQGFGAPETFTVAPGVYATAAAAAIAMAAAVGTMADTFGDYVGCGDGGGGKITLSEIIHQSGSTITEGNGGAAALGFTTNPDTFIDGSGSTGLWLFPGAGVIQQTAIPTPNGDAFIFAAGDEYGAAWALQFDARIDALDAGSMFFAFDAGTTGDPATSPIPFLQNAYGVGLDNDVTPPDVNAHLSMGPNAIAKGGGTPFTVNVGDWHTYKTVGDAAQQTGYFDGTIVMVKAPVFAPPAKPRDPPASRFALAASGAISFRNISAARRALPTST